MKILITGGTGLIGKKLIENLFLEGYTDLIVLSRNKEKAKVQIPFPVQFYNWNVEKGFIEEDALKNVDIVIHLAGDNIAQGRWTKTKKERILKSRVSSTLLLLEKLKASGEFPKKFISASGIDVYGDNFLSDVCKEWEKSLFDYPLNDFKKIVLRTGLVLSPNGGALEKLIGPTNLGLGASLGSGKQFVNWIHIEDLIGLYLYSIESDIDNGTYNAISPHTVSNSYFNNSLAISLNRPCFLNIPAWILKVGLGEMASVLLSGDYHAPDKFLNLGFKFKFGTLESALKDLLQFKQKGEVLFESYQWIPKQRNEVFKFFSDEKNLERITPQYLNFKVIGKSTLNITEGTLIDYKLKIHGVPVYWRTRINEFRENEFFIDEQLSGPYKKWLHSHFFFEYQNGTLIKDRVIYKIPLGFLGRVIAGNFVNKDVNNIFKHRMKVIAQAFG